MPGVVTNKKKLSLGKCLDDLHKLSEIKQLSNNVNIIVRSADKVFRDAVKLDNEGDEERALVMYMKYFNILKQVKTKADYKKQKEYFDSLIGRKNQYQAIERAEKLTESLKDRYDFQKAESLAKKLPSADSVSAKKESPKEKEKDVSKDSQDSSVKAEANVSAEKERKKPGGSISCMQLCDLLRDSGTNLILMDLRPPSDYAQSHVSHSDCISVPADILLPGSTVMHIEAKLTDESKVTWKTRKNADYIILIDWKSKMEDVKIGTPIQTLKDALYKFDTSVIIKSEPLLLEGGYKNWLVFYPTLTTNPHVAVPEQAVSSHKDRAHSPSLLLDFDYPELDENLQNKVKPPPTIAQNNMVNSVDNGGGGVVMNPAIPKVDRSLKPSLANNNNTGSFNNTRLESTNHNSQGFGSSHSPHPSVNNNTMYPSIPQPKVLNGPSQTINTNLAYDPAVAPSKVGQKSINLSVRNNLSTDDQKVDNSNPMSVKNEKVQEGNERTEEVERKLRELDLLKKKKERDVADLMRKERKIKEELENERLKREENQHTLALDEEKRKTALQQAEKEEEERKKRVVDVEKLRMERKRQEEEQKLKLKHKEEEELQRIKAEQEAHALKEEMEKKERQLQQLEEQKKLEQEEEERIAKEMQELEKAKAERIKREELRIMEEKRLEAERQKEQEIAQKKEKELQELAQKEEEERKRRELMELEEEKKAKEKKVLEMKNKENSARGQGQRNERAVPTTNLPTGWEKRLDKDTNRYYYIDHNRGLTTWSAPTAVEGGASAASTAGINNTGIYKTKLKDEPSTLSRSLSRSHSSPNIMKELAEEEEAEALSRKPLVSVNRANKPSANTSNKTVQPMFSMRKRDLNPTYGNVTRGLTGLRNLGNTCYMNSTIQCLNNTSPLITYFLSDNYHRDVNRESSQGMHGEVVDDFSVVIKALWSGQYRSITPRDLKSVIGKYNPMFSGYQQQDSQEFLTFLLDGLHEGLNEVKKAPEIPEQNNDNLSDSKAARLAWEHHKLLHRSVIVELFQGQLKSTLMCRTCTKTSVTFQAFMFLSLPIPASSRCSLKDCIQQFLSPEVMTGSSKWKCPRCKVERDSEKKIDIWKLPPILLVGLNRFYSEGMWMQKKTTYVDFPVTDVDFSPYILGPPPRNRYNLYGISNHYGTMEGGHYTAFCRNSVTTKWYKFDDQDVSDISTSDVKTSAAFVLYYTSIEMPAPHYKIEF